MIELHKPDMSDWTDEQSDEWHNSGNYGSFGTSNSQEAIETFDDLLEPFGLQVGQYHGDSDHQVSIVPLAGGPDKNAAVDVLSQKLEDALKATKSALAREAAIEKKVADGLAKLVKRRNETPQTDVTARALILAQIDYATDLLKSIRGY